MPNLFRLTMCEPAPERRSAYQWRYADAQTWLPLAPRELSGWLEALSAYPDHDRGEIDAGATLVRAGKAFRRRPDPVAQADAARQVALF